MLAGVARLAIVMRLGRSDGSTLFPLRLEGKDSTTFSGDDGSKASTSSLDFENVFSVDACVAIALLPVAR